MDTATTQIRQTPDTTKNRFLLAGGAAAALTAVVHIVGGGIDIARPLMDSSLADEPRLVMVAVWHMASVTMSLSAIALFLGALPRFRQSLHHLTVFIGLLWVGFGLCFIGVGLTEPEGDLLTMLNQWMLLVPTGALALWGARQAGV